MLLPTLRPPSLPLGVVDVLDAPLGIAAKGLDVGSRVRRDPDLLPSRRNRQLSDAIEERCILDSIPVAVEITVAAPVSSANNRQVVAPDTLQSRHLLPRCRLDSRRGL
jgi:hypothetical protein